MTKRKVNRSTVRTFDVDSPRGMKEWKFQVSKRLWEFVKANFPSKHRVTGENFWIDSQTLANALILEGYAFKAADMKGFSAPVGKRTLTRRHAFYTKDYGWRMTDNRAVTGALGVWQRPTEYYGSRHVNATLGFFGVRHEGEVVAYGLDDQGALPVYSWDVCTWLETQADEIQRIIDEAFFEVYGRARSVA